MNLLYGNERTNLQAKIPKVEVSGASTIIPLQINMFYQK